MKSLTDYFWEELKMIAAWDLENRFTYHAPASENVVNEMTMIRNIAHSYATYLNENVPDGREKNLAITKLEEVVFWANAGLARTQTVTKAGSNGH